MKRLICTEFGPPTESLAFEVVEGLVAGPGEVIVCVFTSGVDWTQGLMINNEYQFKPKMPFTPGGEVCGRVKQVGEGVTNTKAGDLVYVGNSIGGFAEELKAKARNVQVLPEHTDIRNFPSMYGYCTSYHALYDRAKLQAGEVLLVLAAAGGVGATAIELGKARGAIVIAAASTEEKLETCRKLGADFTINYSCSAAEFKKQLRELTSTRNTAKLFSGMDDPPHRGGGIDVVYDPIGGEKADAAIRNMAWGGRYCVIGFAAGEIHSIKANLLLNKGSSAVGCALGYFLAAFPKEYEAMKDAVAQMYFDGEIKPFNSAFYDLDDAVSALVDLQGRKIQGKALVVTPAYRQWETKFKSSIAGAGKSRL